MLILLTILSANAHRLFVQRDSSGSSSPILYPLSGIVSVVDSQSSIFFLVNKELILVFY